MTTLDTTIEWLLEPSNPTSRWLALTLLLDRPRSDPEALREQAAIPSSEWAAHVLDGQHPDGWWVDPNNLGLPKLTGTMFRLEALADLGMPVEPPVRTACELFLSQAEYPGEGFATARYRQRTPHECSNGRMLFVFNHFGYGDDARVRAAAEWLLANQMLDGGWNCNHEPKAHRDQTGTLRKDHQCSLDLPHHRSSLFTTMAILKGLATMAEPRREAIARGVEFLLRHRVHRAIRSNRAIYRWPPRLYFPPQLHYDGLQPLRVLAMAGADYDGRLDEALDYLQSRATDWRWPSDGAPMPPSRKSEQTLTLEPPGVPNKWVTVHALAVLRHFGRISL